MAWPDASTYLEVLQNPQLAFTDPELKNGNVVLDKLGLPKPITGNFAVVFEVTNGQRKWAVRCFLREILDQGSRYDEIAKHLHKVNLKSAVSFEFLAQGIRVKGTWYPIVKMEWVPGVRLDEYIRDNLNNPVALKILAANWVTLTQVLRSSNIAHGDLQHGNIIITNSAEIKVIDYDGMYVPTVIGRNNYEHGHRNYQHPSRKNDTGVTSANYLHIDNFSSWVIGTSLVLVSLDPSLWGKTQAGEDNLLFREIDFKQPFNTGTWHLLTRHSDRRVRELGRTFADLCQVSSYLAIPPLDANLQGLTSLSSTRSGTGWLQDHVKPTIDRSVQGNQKTPWILDHLTEKKPVSREFPDDFVAKERIKIQQEFQTLPLVERIFLRFQWQNYVKKYVDEKFNNYTFAEKKRVILAKVKAAEAQKVTVTKQLRTAQAQLSSITDQQRQSTNAHKEADDLNRELNLMPVQLSLYEKQEKEEIANDVAFQLRKIVLAPGQIGGIGKARIARLNTVGIRTAADIVPTNEARAVNALDGIFNCIPVEDWQKLTRWRKAIEDNWKNSPQFRTVTLQTKNKYDTLRSRLLQSQRDKQRRLSILQGVSRLTTNLDAEYKTFQGEASQLEREIDKLDDDLYQLNLALTIYDKLTPENLVSRLLKS